MKTIPLSQGKVALVDDIDYEFLMQWNWYVYLYRNSWRARSTKQGTKKYMHKLVAERMGLSNVMVDHRDQNSLNNCRNNLRDATNSQNQHNTGPHSNNTTGVKGVWRCKRSGRYVAEITVDGKKHRCGYHRTLALAAAAVIAKRVELVGEFACHE
jgi:hypothetical protein